MRVTRIPPDGGVVPDWMFWEKWAAQHMEVCTDIDQHLGQDETSNNATDIVRNAATHINVVSMVSRCVKEWNCSNFEPSSKLFDANVSEVIDVDQLHKHLADAWKQDPFYTRKLIFYMGSMKQQRWVFRFSMKWLCHEHRDEFMLNVDVIPSLMSLQELLEMLSFCVNGEDHPLFGIKTAYAKHLLSKQSHADRGGRGNKTRQYKSSKWRDQQRQAFADSKGVAVSDIWDDAYHAKQKKLYELIDDMEATWGVATGFGQYAQGRLAKMLTIHWDVLFDRFKKTKGVFRPVRYLDYGLKFYNTPLTPDEQDEVHYSDLYNHVPPDFVKWGVSTQNRIEFLEMMLQKMNAVLLYTFENISESLTNKIEIHYEPYVYREPPEPVDPESIKGIYTSYDKEYHDKHGITYHPPGEYEGGFWYDYFNRPEQKFRAFDSIQNQIDEQDRYNNEWFDEYRGNFLFYTEEEARPTDIDSNETLLDHVYWYEDACMDFFCPNNPREWSVRSTENWYDEQVEEYYKGYPWINRDVGELVDVKNAPGYHTNRLIARKKLAPAESDTHRSDLIHEYDEFLRQKQKKESIATNEEKKRLQLQHENWVHKTACKNPFFKQVVEIFVAGLLKELDELNRIENGEKGIVLHGMFAKWAPSPNHHHDKATGIATVISNRLAHILEWNPDRKYTYAHEVLSRLRLAAKIPETFVGKQRWDLVDYRKISAWAMNTTWKTLLKSNDRERFDAYLREDKTVVDVSTVTPSTVFQSYVDAMTVLSVTGKGGKAIDIYTWITLLGLSASLESRNVMSRSTTPKQIDEYVRQAKLDMLLSAKQWKEMLGKAKKSFDKINTDKANRYPKRNCIATILDHVGYDFIPPAYSTATLLANCTAVLGSPLYNNEKCIDGIKNANLICSYGTKATYQKVTNENNPVAACSDLFNVSMDAIANKWEHRKQASIYQAVDLLMKRARDTGTTAEEFATWSLVFISDRSFEDPAALTSTWHASDLPYIQLRDRIDKGGFGAAAGYPKFVFFRESSDMEEEYMNGIPVQSDIVPGVILLSGDSANTVEEVLEACFNKQVTTTKSALSHVLDRSRFDQVRSRFRQ